jgi:hypothetical protein
MVAWLRASAGEWANSCARAARLAQATINPTPSAMTSFQAVKKQRYRKLGQILNVLH